MANMTNPDLIFTAASEAHAAERMAAIARSDAITNLVTAAAAIAWVAVLILLCIAPVLVWATWGAHA